MIKTHCENLNLLWAQLLVEEFYRLGVHDLCIAPGSRNAPLTLAAAAHESITCHTHFDERGLAYYALGLAKASERPVVVICTSGTAVANLYPAFIEAAQTGIPLIVACADRPGELVGCGANQAIHQPGIFADFPVAEVDLAAPDIDFPARALLGKLDDLVNVALTTPGPVLLNCPYREPFYPQQTPVDFTAYLAPLSGWLQSRRPLSRQNINRLVPEKADNWSQNPTTVVVLGAMCRADMSAVIQWAESTGWPILADIQSQAFGETDVVTDVDRLLVDKPFADAQFERVLQFGGRLVSKRMQQWIAAQSGEHWIINPKPGRLDPAWRGDQFWQCPIAEWLAVHPTQDNLSTDKICWLEAQAKLSPVSGEHELAWMAALTKVIPAGSRLMLGNSLSIRELQMVGGRMQGVTCYANRGCSGIDGLLATACGIACDGTPTTLVIGDTSLLHDLNSLALCRRNGINLVIVVINNDGGGIFDLLPVPEKNHVNRDFYQLPHGLTFEGAAAQFGLHYERIDHADVLQQSYRDALCAGGVHLLELASTPGAARREIRRLTRGL